VLPLLYLHGLSSGDFEPALREFFGAEAGLSASTITRLTTSWRSEYAEWERRDLSAVDYVSTGGWTACTRGCDSPVCQAELRHQR
jgi:hypothetical protein